MSLTIERKADPRPRWHTDDLPDGLRVRIPPRRRWFTILFLLVWLALWAHAEGQAIGDLIDGETDDPEFLTIWLVGWTLGGLAALATVLWQLAGEVTLEASQGRLRHRFTLGPLSIGRTYDASLIRNLRASRVGDTAQSWLRSTDSEFLGRGLVLFEYGERAITIRPDLEPSEATNLVNILSSRIPRGAA